MFFLRMANDSRVRPQRCRLGCATLVANGGVLPLFSVQGMSTQLASLTAERQELADRLGVQATRRQYSEQLARAREQDVAGAAHGGRGGRGGAHSMSVSSRCCTSSMMSRAFCPACRSVRPLPFPPSCRAAHRLRGAGARKPAPAAGARRADPRAAGAGHRWDSATSCEGGRDGGEGSTAIVQSSGGSHKATGHDSQSAHALAAVQSWPPRRRRCRACTRRSAARRARSTCTSQTCRCVGWPEV